MTYKITNRQSHPNGLDIDFTPENQALSAIFSQIKKAKYPEFINDMSHSRSTGYEFVHIRNFSDMDWEDKAWAKNVKGSDLEDGEMFLVHDVMGETIIKEELFDKILFEYATELLKVYSVNNILSNNWSAEMQNALRDLKIKIDYRTSRQ